MATDLTKECLEGYDDWRGDRKTEYYFSSDCWLAYEAGVAMAIKGYTAPTKCRKSRGYSVKIQTAANDFVFKAGGDSGLLDIRDLIRV